MCEGAGIFTLDISPHDKDYSEFFGRAWYCPCGANQDRVLDNLLKHYKNPGVPGEYASYTFNTFLSRFTQVADQHNKDTELAFEAKLAAYNIMQRFATKGIIQDADGIRKYGVVLAGEPGMGKTGLMAALANTLIDKQPFLWRDTHILLDEVQATYHNPKGPTKEQLISGAARVPILFMDDMGDPDGEGELSDDKRGILYSIFSPRHQNKLVNFISTNLDKPKFRSMYGKRIYRRVLERCVWIDMGGFDLSTY